MGLTPEIARPPDALARCPASDGVSHASTCCRQYVATGPIFPRFRTESIARSCPFSRASKASRFLPSPGGNLHLGPTDLQNKSCGDDGFLAGGGLLELARVSSFAAGKPLPLRISAK